MKHVFEIPLGTGEGKLNKTKNIHGIPDSFFAFFNYILTYFLTLTVTYLQ